MPPKNLDSVMGSYGISWKIGVPKGSGHRGEAEANRRKIDIAVVPKHPRPTTTPDVPPDPKYVTELTLFATDGVADLLANEQIAKKILLTGVAISMERWPKVTSIRLIGQKGTEVHFEAEAQKADNWILERIL